MTADTDRVRRHTAATVIERIDEGARERLLAYAERPAGIGERLGHLDEEWDTDRAVELEAAVTGMVGLLLGVVVRREFLAIPAMVGGAVLTHALTGWHPLLPVLRRLGVRSAQEIARERYALKALRGDFAEMGGQAAQAGGVDAVEGLRGRAGGAAGSL